MNRFFVLILALAVSVTITACGGAPKQLEQPVQSEAPAESVGTPDTAEQDDIPISDIPQYNSLGIDWGIGVANWYEGLKTPTRIAVYGNMGPSTSYNKATYRNRELDIGYIGEKEASVEGFYYFESYENTAGSDYEIIDPAQAEGIPGRTFFLYNSEDWGDMAGSINHAPEEYSSEPADNTQIAAMEKEEGGRSITQSELLGIFTMNNGGDNYVSMMRYENSGNGLFKIVLCYDMNNYYTKDYPCELSDGIAAWRVDMYDDPGAWDLLFAGKVSGEIFLVTAWADPEGRFIIPFVAKDGKLVENELPDSFYHYSYY